MRHVFQVFRKNEIDMPLFLTLTDKELKEVDTVPLILLLLLVILPALNITPAPAPSPAPQVGIELLGPRRKLTGAIARLREREETKILQ